MTDNSSAAPDAAATLVDDASTNTLGGGLSGTVQHIGSTFLARICNTNVQSLQVINPLCDRGFLHYIVPTMSLLYSVPSVPRSPPGLYLSSHVVLPQRETFVLSRPIPTYPAGTVIATLPYSYDCPSLFLIPALFVTPYVPCPNATTVDSTASCGPPSVPIIRTPSDTTAVEVKSLPSTRKERIVYKTSRHHRAHISEEQPRSLPFVTDVTRRRPKRKIGAPLMNEQPANSRRHDFRLPFDEN